MYSRSLPAAITPRTRIERVFDPEAIRQLKRTNERDLSIGGPELAGHAFRAQLIDECQFFLSLVAVGAGKPALPANMRLLLKLLNTRQFANGTVYLHYQVQL